MEEVLHIAKPTTFGINRQLNQLIKNREQPFSD